MARPQTLVISAAAVALLARLAFGLGYWIDKPLTLDEQEYLMLAGNLATGEGFTYGPEPEPTSADGPLPPQRFSRAPGYPFFVSLVTDLSDGLPSSVPTELKLAQAVIGTVGVLLIGLIARQVAGGAAGLTALWIAAVYPPLVWIAGYAMTEALYSVLALGSVVLAGMATDEMDSTRRSRSLWLGLAAGIVGGAATLVRPATLASSSWRLRGSCIAAGRRWC